MDFDVETMIFEVRARPELWDTSLEIYKDRNRKREGWKDVCTNLFDDFEEQNKADQVTIEKSVYSKWRTVRDGFVKWKKKEKQLKKSATTKKPIHKYVYANKLEFLSKCLREAEVTSVSASTSSETIQSDQVNHQNNSPSSTASRKTHRKTQKEVPGVEDEITSNFGEASEFVESQLSSRDDEDEDEDMSFFKSVLPTVRKLNQFQKFQFRIQLMNNLQNILMTTPNIAQSYQFPGTPFYQPSTFHPVPLQSQQSNPTLDELQNPPTTTLDQHEQASSSSHHQLQPQSTTKRKVLAKKASSITSRHPYSPQTTNSSDSSLTLDDYREDDNE